MKKNHLLASICSPILLITFFAISTFATPSLAHAASVSSISQTSSIKGYSAIPNAGPACLPTVGISEPYPWSFIQYNGGARNCTKSDVIDAYADLYQYDGKNWVLVQEAEDNCSSCYGMIAYGQYYAAQDNKQYKVEGTYVAADSSGVNSDHTWTLCWIFHTGAPLTLC